MRVLIFQLSDIHCTDNSDKFQTKLTKAIESVGTIQDIDRDKPLFGLLYLNLSHLQLVRLFQIGTSLDKILRKKRAPLREMKWGRGRGEGKKKAPFERCCLPSVFWVLLEHGYLIIHGVPMK